MTETDKTIIKLLTDIKWDIFAIWIILVIFLVSFLATERAHAADPWTKNQKWTYYYFTSLNIIDLGQTYSIYESPTRSEKFFLASAILEDKPENAKYVPLMFIGSNLTCLGVAHFLPSKWYWIRPRQWFLSGVTFFEVYAVGRNFCYGVKWRIPF